ncbi:MAG: hydroxyethylthiazole kinase [Subtercola sp.]|nr:hydroxyethylthiazole kinase [Subtercola sp.]
MTIRPAPETPAHLLARLREAPPLVQCLTNSVVTNFTANVLLALGASGAMVDIPGEAGAFAGIASGVLVNLGTPTAEQRTAMVEAATAAGAAGTPWVLDPVAIGSLPVRTALAAQLVQLRPTVIRGNPSEIIALAGLGAGGRGVDSTATGEEAVDAARTLSQRFGSVVAVSGAVDIIVHGDRIARLANGHPLLTVVTGGGCALGAVMAAFLGAAGAGGAPRAGTDAFAATCAAVTTYTVAAEIAAEHASGPGTFAVAFLDALASVGSAELDARARTTKA